MVAEAGGAGGASLCGSRSFGPRMAAGAQGRNCYAAKTRAFGADGVASNRTIPRGYFAGVEPIVDLRHVVGHLVGAARAVPSDQAHGWTRHQEWLRAGGRVGSARGSL